MNTAELIYQNAKNVPDFEAREILDFMEFLQEKRARGFGSSEENAVTLEEHAAWCERLRRLIDSQPTTDGDTAITMRHEARY
jgi:hypothetical protein